MNDNISLNTLEHCSTIENLSEPLISLLKIKGLTYQRIFPNGERICLCESPVWAQYFTSKKYQVATGFRSIDKVKKYTLWKCWPEDDLLHHKLFQEARENFGFDNGLLIMRPRDTYLETITLRGRYGGEDSNNLYLANLDIIENFIDYFIDQLNSLIQQLTMKLNVHTGESSEEEKIPHTQCEEKDFNYKHILSLLHHYFYQINYKGASLSKREVECLVLLMLGSSAKDIGIALGVSPRTVEVYLNHLKIKTNSNTKSGAISKICTNASNRKKVLYLLDKLKWDKIK